jgi:hypothetical protein
LSDLSFIPLRNFVMIIRFRGVGGDFTAVLRFHCMPSG